jgi:hypothetical protein
MALDASNHYRIYEANGNLSIEKNIAGTKTQLKTIPYDSTNHMFWRIRHDATANQIVFETAPGASGTPGTWTEQLRVAPEFAVTALWLELRAGTPTAYAVPPGTPKFDNVRVAK